MIKKYISMSLLAMVLSASNTSATTFQPMSLEKLVEESNGAAEVELKSKKSYMNQMGMIFTEYTFKVLESYNLSSTELDGESLKLTMAGGTANGVTSYIDSAPDFYVDERSFLLLKKVESRIYLSNFSMGKYKITENEGKIYYVSSVFPADPEIGIIKKEKMVEMVKLKYKLSRVPDVDPRIEKDHLAQAPAAASSKEQSVFKKRSPAQEDADERESHEGVWAMWFFLGLITVSGFTIWSKLSKGVS